MGGYVLPPTSTPGSQVQRSASGTTSMTAATWLPQPNQVVFSGGAVCGERRVRPGSEVCTHCRWRTRLFDTWWAVSVVSFSWKRLERMDGRGLDAGFERG